MIHLTLTLFFALSGVLLATVQLWPGFDTPDKKLLFAAVHNDAFTLLNGSILKVNDGQTLIFDEGDLLDGASPICAGMQVS